MTKVWDDTRFKGTELLVLLALADHANDEGICFPSLAKISVRARCSKRQVQRCLDHLKAEGWISVVGQRPTAGGWAVNIYRVAPPMDIVSTRQNVYMDILGGQYDTQVTPPVDIAVSTESPIESPREPPVARSSDRAREIPSFEEVLEYGSEVSTLTETHIEAAAERWMGSLDLRKIGEWRKSFGAFLEKYEGDVRK